MSTRNITWLQGATVCGLSLMLSVCAASAQTKVSDNIWELDKDRSSPPAVIADFAWIAGHWEGTALGGTFEETWNPPKGNSMIGMFKFLKDDKVQFCELLTLVPAGDSVTLRLKHFDAHLRGWEAKDEAIEFRLVRVSDHEACFDGLTFRRTGTDRLQIFVLFHDPGKPDHEVEFAARLAPPPSAPQAAPAAGAATPAAPKLIGD